MVECMGSHSPLQGYTPRDLRPPALLCLLKFSPPPWSATGWGQAFGTTYPICSSGSLTEKMKVPFPWRSSIVGWRKPLMAFSVFVRGEKGITKPSAITWIWELPGSEQQFPSVPLSSSRSSWCYKHLSHCFPVSSTYRMFPQIKSVAGKVCRPAASLIIAGVAHSLTLLFSP